jgi:cobalt-zinc-cadmium efflux system protein
MTLMSAGTAPIDTQLIARYRAIYVQAWLLSLVIVVIELIGARLAGSFALRADVFHVAGDMLVASAPLAMSFARQQPRHLRAILLWAGVAIAMSLIAIGIWLMLEARDSLALDSASNVHGWLLAGFALTSAGANWWQHHVLSRVRAGHRDVTHLGFHFHVRMDLLKNLALPTLGALIALHLIANQADGWAAACIGAWICARGFILGIGSVVTYSRAQPFPEG